MDYYIGLDGGSTYLKGALLKDRQVPPGYPCIQPIQNSIEHCPAAFFGPSAMCRFFWRQLPFHLILLFFCQCVPLHTFALLLVLFLVYLLVEEAL